MVNSRIVEIRSTIRNKAPSLPFARVARAILGPTYELSLVLCGDALAQKMNRTYRKKDYPANVLSFSYGKREGEIFLNVRKAAREARRLGIPTKSRIAHLFIHGCLHLAGLPHGKKMDFLEQKILNQLDLVRSKH